MTPYERHLTAAAGYLELGMAADASAELDSIEPVRRSDWQVLALRVAVCQETKDWVPMLLLSERLVAMQPAQSQWLISLAYATRRCQSLEAARKILLGALDRFPEESTIPFNLACYEAQLGRLELARDHLVRAIQMNGAHRAMALADTDLAPLHEELRRGEW